MCRMIGSAMLIRPETPMISALAELAGVIDDERTKIQAEAAIALNFYEGYCMPVMEYGTNKQDYRQYQHRFWLSET